VEINLGYAAYEVEGQKRRKTTDKNSVYVIYLWGLLLNIQTHPF